MKERIKTSWFDYLECRLFCIEVELEYDTENVADYKVLDLKVTEQEHYFQYFGDWKPAESGIVTMIKWRIDKNLYKKEIEKVFI